MKKGFIFGLLVLAGFSNAAIAAPTSLSFPGTWQEATGTLNGLLNQSTLGQVNYDTDFSVGDIEIDYSLFYGGKASGGFSTSYTYSNSPLSIMENLSVGITAVNGVNPSLQFCCGNSHLSNSLSSIGITSGDLVDGMSFSGSIQTNDTDYDLSVVAILDETFFSGPIVSFPSADDLFNNALLLHIVITEYDLSNYNILGRASSSYIPSAVPVPAAAFMFAPALLGFLGLRRKAKHSIS